jgi:hypothetical protein
MVRNAAWLEAGIAPAGWSRALRTQDDGIAKRAIGSDTDRVRLAPSSLRYNTQNVTTLASLKNGPGLRLELRRQNWNKPGNRPALPLDVLNTFW